MCSSDLGLFGLIASFHCNTIGYSRQIFALAREGFLPTFLSDLHPRFRTPHYALLAGGVVGLVALLTGSTDKLIILSVLGAIVMYITSMMSLFALRRKEPNLYRPFKTPFYPWFPLIALVLSLVCLLAIMYYNRALSLLFFSTLSLSLLLFWRVGVPFSKAESPNQF